MVYNQFELPNQNLPEAKWIKRLYVEHANLMINFIGNGTINERNENIAKLYRAYNCELSAKEEKANDTITKQYGYSLGVLYEIYPLVEMLVDQLVGEYISLPMKKKSYSINKKAINQRLEEKINYIGEEIFREQNKELESEVGFTPETENPDIELPDNVEEFFLKTFKTHSEELSDDLVELFLEVLKEKRKIKTLLQDFLIAEECCGFIDVKNGHPTIKRAQYNETYYDLNPEEEIQTDINVFGFFPLMTKNEILNKYELDDKQVKKINDIFSQMGANKLITDPFKFGGSTGVDMGYNNCPNGVSYRSWYDENSRQRLRTLVMMWKSRKQVRVKTHINKHTNEEIFTILTDDAKPRKRDNVQTKTVEVIRYVEMLGPELMLRYGISDERMSFIDNPKAVHLPVVALKGRNTMYSTTIRSVAAKLAPLQKMASDILFELRLAIKANSGRVLVYDLAQMPKQFLDTYGKKNAINRMLHHIKKDKILLFNSKDRASKATFNQFTALDLSNKGQVQDLINALILIEDLGRKFTGLTKERSGEVGQYQTASGTDRAVLASNARTEIYFNPFDEFAQGLLQKMIAKAKFVYKAGQVFSYIFGDLQNKFLTIFKEFFNVDLGIYIGDRFKDKKDKEIIDGAATQALGNATDKELILDLINVLEADHASESKAILERGMRRFEELQQQNSKAAEEAQKAERAHAMALEDRIDEREKRKIDKDIKVANIYAGNKTHNEDQARTSNELITAAKLELEREKLQADKEKKPEKPKAPAKKES